MPPLCAPPQPKVWLRPCSQCSFVQKLLFISDPQIEAQVTLLAEPLSEFRLDVVGRTFALLEGPRACRLGECNLGKA